MILIEDLEIAPHLTYGEMMDRESGLCLAHLRLLHAWTAFRGQLGHPIRVNSGFRTESYNRKIGGSPRSRHLLGMAIDMQCAVIDLSDLEMIPMLICCGFRGIGRGDGWIHADVRSTATFWRYTDAGIVRDIEAYNVHEGG